MLKITWTTHTLDEKVFLVMNTSRKLVNTIKARQNKYFGLIITGPQLSLLRLMIQGEAEETRWIGREELSELKI